MGRSIATTDGIKVEVTSRYVPERSVPPEDLYFFAYKVKVSNDGREAARLVNRHWLITDADNEVQEVRGEGVVGEQPVIPPHASFRYTSGATLATPVGCMEGSYFMVVREPMDKDPHDLPEFEVPIRAFSLHTPTALN